MPKLPRINQRTFGQTAGASGNFGVFGSLNAGTPTYSKDLTTIQSLSNFLEGLGGALVGNKSPAMQDINSLFLLAFEQIAYLFEAGVPEWHADETYYIHSFCRVGNVVYISKTDNNTGNNPATDTNNWRDKRSLELEFRYPVGEVLITRVAGNPASWMGFGTWVRYGEGRMPVFQSTTDSDFANFDQTGGDKTVSLTPNQVPPHEGARADGNTLGGGLANNSYYANGEPHQNMPPYIVLSAWLRTA